ncbi:MAG: alcohol dehydrogenase catalytic domain-containing protein [Pirellulaceae bacterium]|nr:alcohol dehydrogenase catalytic domain-containing protein [Pirellulaceae bacterium]
MSHKTEHASAPADQPMPATAAVFYGPDESLEIRGFPMPIAQEGEVVIEISCCTLCGSDLHTITGRRHCTGQAILGHEAIGRVCQLPPNGPVLASDERALQLGDRVTWGIVASCHQCRMCKRGLTQKCEKLIKFGHEAVDGSGRISGGLATHCLLPRGSTIVRLPDSLPDQVACPANCAAATVLAAIRVIGPCEGKRVLVMGGGMLGLMAAAAARYHRAKTVVVCDPQPNRREWALRFGADATMDRVIPQHQEGFDIAIDMTGVPDAIEPAFDALAIGGHLLLIGSVFPSRDLAIPAEQIVRRMIRIEGLHNYTGSDLVNAVDFLAATWKQFPFLELVDTEYSLKEVNQAIQAAIAGRHIRTAIRPQI